MDLQLKLTSNLVIVVGTRQRKRAKAYLEPSSHIMWSRTLGDSNSIRGTYHATIARDNFENEIVFFFPHT